MKMKKKQHYFLTKLGRLAISILYRILSFAPKEHCLYLEFQINHRNPSHYQDFICQFRETLAFRLFFVPK